MIKTSNDLNVDKLIELNVNQLYVNKIISTLPHYKLFTYLGEAYSISIIGKFAGTPFQMNK